MLRCFKHLGNFDCTGSMFQWQETFGSVWNSSFEPGLNLVSGSHRFGSEPVRSEPAVGDFQDEVTGSKELDCSALLLQATLLQVVEEVVRSSRE